LKKIIILLFFSLLFADSFNDFKTKFIKYNSYTIDPYNNNRVTSESQGYTLYLCVKNNNQQLFDSIWKWTKAHMQRKDNLFSWEYNKKIIDKNNATDGDLFISYSLLLAYEKWGNKQYLKNFKLISREIKKLFLPIFWNKSLNILLFPGKYGFLKDNVLQIYPSYYIPFIFKKFSRYDEFYKNVYLFTKSLYKTKDLTTKLYYDLINKVYYQGKFFNMNVYRLIPYAKIDNENLDYLKRTFFEVNNFFNKNGFIPLTLYVNGKYKGKSPYCIYKWFYFVYKNAKYLKKFNILKKYDKRNYFCEALDLMLKEK